VTVTVTVTRASEPPAVTGGDHAARPPPGGADPAAGVVSPRWMGRLGIMSSVSTCVTVLSVMTTSGIPGQGGPPAGAGWAPSVAGVHVKLNEQCMICGLPSGTSLNSNATTSQSDVDFYCDPCEKSFKLASQLEAHVTQHVTCSFAGCTFSGDFCLSF
jgi:hypothetical protein